MRTTLDIDDDILAAAKELARAEGKTAGKVISDLVRKSLTQPMAGGLSEAAAAYQHDDWPTFPRRSGGRLVTNELVRQVEEELDVEDATPWDHERDAPREFGAGPPKSPGKS